MSVWYRIETYLLHPCGQFFDDLRACLDSSVLLAPTAAKEALPVLCHLYVLCMLTALTLV
jgi:hypothetical protein